MIENSQKKPPSVSHINKIWYLIIQKKTKKLIHNYLKHILKIKKFKKKKKFNNTDDQTR